MILTFALIIESEGKLKIVKADRWETLTSLTCGDYDEKVTNFLQDMDVQPININHTAYNSNIRNAVRNAKQVITCRRDK